MNTENAKFKNVTQAIIIGDIGANSLAQVTEGRNIKGEAYWKLQFPKLGQEHWRPMLTTPTYYEKEAEKL